MIRYMRYQLNRLVAAFDNKISTYPQARPVNGLWITRKTEKPESYPQASEVFHRFSTPAVDG